MLDAAEPAADRPGDTGAGPGREGLDESGPLLGRFEILDDLGSGGFGFVVRARDLVLGREVALKLPLPERVLAALRAKNNAKPLNLTEGVDPTAPVRFREHGGALWFKGKGPKRHEMDRPE